MKEAKRLNIQWLMLLVALCALTGAFALFGGHVEAAATEINVGTEVGNQPYDIYIRGNEWGIIDPSTGWGESKGTLTEEGVVLTGDLSVYVTPSVRSIYIQSTPAGPVTLSGLTVDTSLPEERWHYTNMDTNSAIVIAAGADVTLNLEGENKLTCDLESFTTGYKGSLNDPMISVGDGANLTIGGDGSLTIDSKTNPTDTTYGLITAPAIGSPADVTCGNITFAGGTVSVSQNAYELSGEGVGGRCGSITVNEGASLTVSQTAAQNITGAGIGGSVSGAITVNGTADVTQNTSYQVYSAGIGSSAESYGGNITLNGDVTVTQNADFMPSNVGIGGGMDGRCGSISITGGSVKVQQYQLDQGSTLSVGIGSAEQSACGAIAISDSVVEIVASHVRIGNNSYCDIGGGGFNGAVTIDDNALVRANSIYDNLEDEPPKPITLTLKDGSGEALADATVTGLNIGGREYRDPDLSTGESGTLKLWWTNPPAEDSEITVTVAQEGETPRTLTGRLDSGGADLYPEGQRLDLSKGDFAGKDLYIFNDGYALKGADDPEPTGAETKHTDGYILTGGTAENPLTNRVIVMDGYRNENDATLDLRTITLDNLHLKTENNQNLIDIRGNANAKLAVAEDGDSSLTSTYSNDLTSAVLRVAQGASLTLDGPGQLTLKATATGNGWIDGAGIGSNDNEASGAITLQNANVAITMQSASSFSGAAIGSGSSGNNGKITIDNSRVAIDITPGSFFSGSAIGGKNNVTIDNSRAVVTFAGGCGVFHGTAIGGHQFTDAHTLTLKEQAVVQTVFNISPGKADGAQIGGVGSKQWNLNVSADSLLLTDTSAGSIPAFKVTEASLNQQHTVTFTNLPESGTVTDVTIGTNEAWTGLSLTSPFNLTTGATMTVGDAVQVTVDGVNYVGTLAAVEDSTTDFTVELQKIDGNINLSDTAYQGQNLYIFNDGYAFAAENQTAPTKAAYPFTGSYTLSGGSAEVPLTNRVIVMGDFQSDADKDGIAERTITLSGLHLGQTQDVTPFSVNAGANVTLNLAEGTENRLSTGLAAVNRNAVLYVGGNVTITGNGKMKVDFNSSTTLHAAVIGGNRNDPSEATGSLTIESGTIEVSATANKYQGAIIGSAGVDYENEGSHAFGTITINGGTVNVTVNGGQWDGGGARIGGGNFGGCEGITITGGSVSVVDHTVGSGTGNAGAGIGSGNNSIKETPVVISGGTVTVTADNPSGHFTGAGIGGAQGGDGAAADVTIRGGIVNVTMDATQTRGACIGSGAGADKQEYGGGFVTITGGRVTAKNTGTHQDNGAAIGCGDHDAIGVDVTISGGTITADAGDSENCPDIGIGEAHEHGYGGTTTVTISGGSINASKIQVEEDNNGYTVRGAVDGKGNPVYCNTLTLQDVAPETRMLNDDGTSKLDIGGLSADQTYGLKDVVTTASTDPDSSTLYLWLPASEEAAIGYTEGATNISRTYTRTADEAYTVTLLPAAVYTVTIPAEVSMAQGTDGSLSGSGAVKATGLENFIDRRTLKVTVNGQNPTTYTGFDLRLGDGEYTLPYNIAINGENLLNGGSVLSATDNQEQNRTLDFSANSPDYSGTYTDTLTFTVTVDEGIA